MRAERWTVKVRLTPQGMSGQSTLMNSSTSSGTLNLYQGDVSVLIDLRH